MTLSYKTLEELDRLHALEKSAEKYCELVKPEVPCFAKYLKPKSLRPTGQELWDVWKNDKRSCAGTFTYPAIFLLERFQEDYRYYSDGFMDDLLQKWIAAYHKELEE